MKQLAALLMLVELGLLAAAAEQINRKPFGKHDFPLYTPQGKSSANEFQFIQPAKIVDRKTALLKDSAGTYSIDSVNPTLISNDDVVTVKYTSSSPKSSDWIGAYSPADVDITTTVPVKYAYCDDSDTYMSSGAGSLTFNL